MLFYGVSSCPCSLNAVEITFIHGVLKQQPIVSGNEIVQYAGSLICAIAKLSGCILWSVNILNFAIYIHSNKVHSVAALIVY